jgi:hypothetical protein
VAHSEVAAWARKPAEAAKAGGPATPSTAPFGTTLDIVSTRRTRGTSWPIWPDHCVWVPYGTSVRTTSTGGSAAIDLTALGSRASATATRAERSPPSAASWLARRSAAAVASGPTSTARRSRPSRVSRLRFRLASSTASGSMSLATTPAMRCR